MSLLKHIAISQHIARPLEVTLDMAPGLTSIYETFKSKVPVDSTPSALETKPDKRSQLLLTLKQIITETGYETLIPFALLVARDYPEQIANSIITDILDILKNIVEASTIDGLMKDDGTPDLSAAEELYAQFRTTLLETPSPAVKRLTSYLLDTCIETENKRHAIYHAIITSALGVGGTIALSTLVPDYVLFLTRLTISFLPITVLGLPLAGIQSTPIIGGDFTAPIRPLLSTINGYLGSGPCLTGDLKTCQKAVSAMRDIGPVGWTVKIGNQFGNWITVKTFFDKVSPYLSAGSLSFGASLWIAEKTISTLKEHSQYRQDQNRLRWSQAGR